MLTQTVNVQQLRVGDEFWGDPPYKFSHTDPDAAERTDFAYKVIGDPLASINGNLFFDRDDEACIVVPVEYADGGRGSRLFAPETTITIRRNGLPEAV